MNRARGILESAGFEVHASIIDVEAESVIAGYQQEHGVGMLVMGAYVHPRIRQLLVGSTTTAMIRAAQVPLLLLR